MDEDKLREMAEHFRKLAAESSCLLASSDLMELADEYDVAARGLVSSGDTLCGTPLVLPGSRVCLPV